MKNMEKDIKTQTSEGIGGLTGKYFCFMPFGGKGFEPFRLKGVAELKENGLFMFNPIKK